MLFYFIVTLHKSREQKHKIYTEKIKTWERKKYESKNPIHLPVLLIISLHKS